jgi:rubrerythrin
MTAGNLRSAFAGESQAHMRYAIFSDRTEKEGFPNVARLFQAVANAEQVHATNHYTELRQIKGDFLVAVMAPFGLGSTSDNLQVGIDGETFEIEEMYPVYKAAAQFQKEKGAERTFAWALQTEKVHASLYRTAKEAIDGGRDPQIGHIHVCQVCGYTIEGDLPDRCPLCNAKKEKFESFLV